MEQAPTVRLPLRCSRIAPLVLLFLEVCPIILLCRLMVSVRSGGSVTEGPKNRTHTFHSSPSSAPVWQRFAIHWAAVTQGPAPRFTADLLLTDDPRGGWYLTAELLPVWHHLRLSLISKLWAAYCTVRLPPTAPSTAARIAARVRADTRATI
jgi:hypothetical protein